jgi:hypothetical protein
VSAGKPVVSGWEEMPPATSYAQRTTITGAATPAEAVPVLAFDGGSSDEYMDFLCRLSEDYAGGGLTFKGQFSMASATSNNVRLGIAIRRLNDDAEDIDTTAHSYSFQEATVAVASAVGEPKYFTIAFTDGAQMDSWAAGELAIVRFRREASDTTNDTAAGDMYLIHLDAIETAA